LAGLSSSFVTVSAAGSFPFSGSRLAPPARRSLNTKLYTAGGWHYELDKAALAAVASVPDSTGSCHWASFGKDEKDLFSPKLSLAPAKRVLWSPPVASPSLL